MKHFKECIEIVGGLVDVHDDDRSIGAYTTSQCSDGRPQGQKRVLPLRRTVIGDDQRRISAVERDCSRSLLQQWQSQACSPRRNRGMQIVRTAAFHHAVRCGCPLPHDGSFRSSGVRIAWSERSQTRLGLWRAIAKTQQRGESLSYILRPNPVYGELLFRRATRHATLLHPFLYVIDFKRALSFG